MTYVDLLIIALSGGLLAYFYNSLLEEDMLLEKLGERLQGKWFLKPFGGCAYCTVPYLTMIMFLLWSYSPVVWEIVSLVILSYYLLHLLFKFE